MNERQIHEGYVRWLKKVDLYQWGFHSPNGEKRDSYTASLLVNLGVQKGIPDWLFIKPMQGFNGMALEMKAKNGRASKHQLEWIEKFKQCGWHAQVYHDIMEMIHMTAWYFDLKDI